eukprot:COSAG01_NODE_158_length_23708_cov_7.921979_9_plen_391_part_00
MCGGGRCTRVGDDFNMPAGLVAGSDQNGRPVLMAMGWAVPLTHASRADYSGSAPIPSACFKESHLNKARGLILHELLHGMGFSVQIFNSQYDANGLKKQLVEMRAVTDIDGDVDQIWHVISPRVLSVAQTYFGCPSLTALPLMGANSLGPSQRGSHWETRILADEILAYGTGQSVSPFTLAMFEDLGYYVGNYSKAECMFWGRSMGCRYVTTRCGQAPARTQLPLLVGASSASCAKGYCELFGKTSDSCTTSCYSGNSIVASKCVNPRCDLEVGTFTGTCKPECFTPQSASDWGQLTGNQSCGSVPPGFILAAGAAIDDETPVRFTGFLMAFIVACVVVLLIFLVALGYAMTGEHHAVFHLLAMCISIMHLVVGLLLVVGCIVFYTQQVL